MRYYVVDAFTDTVFQGNPAGVCLLDHEIPDTVMQKIAAENRYSETAFVCKKGKDYLLRWFTPTFEIDLCGHATLASAYVICHLIEPELQKVIFETISGTLSVAKRRNQLELSFPQRPPKPIAITEDITNALGIRPTELFSARDLYVVVQSAQEVVDFVPDYSKLQQLHNWLGIAVTSPGTDCDFVSRFFCPKLQLEDPVTGSSHSSLIPLWHKKLHQTKFLAKQLSERGGMLYCAMGETDVKIAGEAKLYLQGEIYIS